MARTHMIDGVAVPYTPQEEAARDAEEAQQSAKRSAKTARLYRHRRRLAYAGLDPALAGLGGEKGESHAIGDMLDVLMQRVRQIEDVLAAVPGVTLPADADWTTTKARIDAIKTAYPKP